MIPLNLYKKIHQNMPILCVDVVIWDGQGRFLLVKRNNEPARNEWWMIGGRVNKGERLQAAAARKIRQELGVDGKILHCLGSDETLFETGPFGTPTHTVNFVFLATVKNAQIKLDQQSTEFAWFDKVNRKWHPYVKKFTTLTLKTYGKK